MACCPSRWFQWMRYLLITLCTMLFLSGFLLLGLGAWIFHGAINVTFALDPYLAQLNMSYVCFGMGAMLIFINLIGCCVAWKEKRCCLMLFFSILTTLFAAEVAGTILVLVYRELAGVVVWHVSKLTFQKLYMGPSAADPVSTAWNTIMIEFKCCGFENSTADFEETAFSKSTGLKYPKTCCINMTPACDGINLHPDLIHPQSCFKKVISLIKEKSTILGATAGTICVFELLTMILTILMLLKLGNDAKTAKEQVGTES